jgi:Holliday junction resolvase RusA-like endonuclease
MTYLHTYVKHYLQDYFNFFLLVYDSIKKGELMAITYLIPCTPVPWKRAGNCKGRYYDTQVHTKVSTGIYIKNQHDGTFFKNVPLLLTVTFYLPIPQSWSKKKKEEMAGKPMIFIPDTSNCVKFIEDVCTQLLYEDDCLISDIVAKKRYDDGKGPRTEFTIERVTC